MVNPVCIAVDAMSGDHGPSVAVPAAFKFLERNETSKVILVGDREQLEVLAFSENEKYPLKDLYSRCHIVHAETVIGMHEKPSLALRNRHDSSMAKALSLIKSGDADACVSAGNTGALMVLGRSILGMFHGIDRPAITKLFPSKSGGSLVLDLGANVDSSAEQLMQFALMGQLLAQVIKHKPNPTVALLNVGEESIKGNELVRLADTLIREHEAINYIGFAEGGDIFRGKADVLVCDGFVGNVALKSAEGAASIILSSVREFFEKNIYRRLLAKIIMPMMSSALRQLDPETHNGAMFLGLNGVVVKSHGNSGSAPFSHAIELAAQEAEANLPELINQALEVSLYS